MARFRPEASSLLNLTGWDHYLAWAERSSEESPPNRIVVYDIATKKKRTVARATTSKAKIEGIVGDRDTVVFGELARPDTTTDVNVPWSEYMLDLKTGAKRKILSFQNDKPRQVVLPLPSFEWPWVIETLPGESGGLDVMAYDVRSNKWKTLVSGVHSGFSFHIDRGLVIFGARSEDAKAGATDIFSIPVEGTTEPRRLTFSGEVEGLVTANGASAWHEPIEGDPMSLWWLAIGEPAKPRKFHDEGGYSVFPGKGFVVWTPILGDQLLIQDPLGTRPPVQLAGANLYLGARWVAFDDRVAWVTAEEEGSPVEIHVVRISFE